MGKQKHQPGNSIRVRDAKGHILDSEMADKEIEIRGYWCQLEAVAAVAIIGQL